MGVTHSSWGWWLLRDQQRAPPELHYLWHDGETEAKALQRYPRSPLGLELDHWSLACFFPESGVSSRPPSSLRSPPGSTCPLWDPSPRTPEPGRQMPLITKPLKIAREREEARPRPPRPQANVL